MSLLSIEHTGKGLAERIGLRLAIFFFFWSAKVTLVISDRFSHAIVFQLLFFIKVINQSGSCIFNFSFLKDVGKVV